MDIRLPDGLEFGPFHLGGGGVGDQPDQSHHLAELQVAIVIIEGRGVECQDVVEQPVLDPDLVGGELFGIVLVVAGVGVEAAEPLENVA